MPITKDGGGGAGQRLTAAQVAALVKSAGFPAAEHVTAVAVCKAESNFYVGAKNSRSSASGLWQVMASVHRQYDARLLLTDADYNTKAAYAIWSRAGKSWRPWEAYNNGAYKKHLAEARQAVAQAAAVNGKPSLPTAPSAGGSTTATTTPSAPQKPALTYGPPGPQLTAAGVGTPLTALGETSSPLAPLRIYGSQMWGDYSKVIIGQPTYEAGIETIPHLKFTILDPEGDLLFRHRNVFVQGARVQYSDLDLRIDQIQFEPGGHGTGQLTITAIDAVVYALMLLRGPASAGGISAVQWIAEELKRCGIDPNRYFLGESVVTQSEIIRDVPDQEGAAGQGDTPSAWTTIVRLARELGKRCFISGNRLVFGSSAFAMRWTAPGQIRLTRHAALPQGEKWLDMPTAKRVSVGSRDGVLEVTGKVPLNRALYFRPGVPVIVRNTPAIAGDEWVELMVSKVSFGLATDVEGADITLMMPVDPPAQPPQSPTTPNSERTSIGGTVSGGGADGQIDRFVALALAQAGNRYVFGAEASPSDPDPKQFDCCLAGHVGVSTANRGVVPVGEIRVGDQVYSCDLKAGNTMAVRDVIAWARQSPRPIHRIRADDKVIDATGNHPFLCATRSTRWSGITRRRRELRWVNAEDLKVGDWVVSLDRQGDSPVSSSLRRLLPKPWTVSRVQAIEIVAEAETFDIQVEGTGNFVAEGLVVSNSELVEWAAARAGITPRVPDGSAAQLAHCRAKGTTIPVQTGINTKGALLFMPGHVAISLGNGKTIEAMNPSAGVRQGNAAGRGWTAAGRIPGAQGYR